MELARFYNNPLEMLVIGLSLVILYYSFKTQATNLKPLLITGGAWVFAALLEYFADWANWFVRFDRLIYLSLLFVLSLWCLGWAVVRIVVVLKKFSKQV